MERVYSSATPPSEEDLDLRRGPWTVEEDLTLMTYIDNHGEGRWNSLARCAGLKRTGKSCRLRWLNYLRPDVRRGNITPEEQLLILELHSRWGNRWSKIAQQLPGRTDNEIKNYWRTRVQKHAKQLHCDVNSKQFKDVMRYLWMPRLLERIQAASASATATSSTTTSDYVTDHSSMIARYQSESYNIAGSSSSSVSPQLPVSDGFTANDNSQSGGLVEMQADQLVGWCPEMLPSPYGFQGSLEFDQSEWGQGLNENMWSIDDIWSLQQQQL